MGTLWFASNAAAAVLLARLFVRKILPWFRALLVLMLIQVVLVAPFGPRSRAFAALWGATEPLLVVMEAASVLELINLLIRGRLNTTLGALRWFGVAIWCISFSAALAPLAWETGAGWGKIAALIVRTRGYTALGMLVFLSITAWILMHQPVPLARGLVLHTGFLAANFAILASSLFLANLLPRALYAHSTTLLLAGTALVFAGWTKALWSAPVLMPELEVDADSARLAKEEYRKFRDRVRSLHE